MIEFLRIPRIPIDECRKRRFRRMLWHFFDDYNGDIVLLGWCASWLVVGVVIFWIYGTWPR